MTFNESRFDTSLIKIEKKRFTLLNKILDEGDVNNHVKEEVENNLISYIRNEAEKRGCINLNMQDLCWTDEGYLSVDKITLNSLCKYLSLPDTLYLLSGSFDNVYQPLVFFKIYEECHIGGIKVYIPE